VYVAGLPSLLGPVDSGWTKEMGTARAFQTGRPSFFAEIALEADAEDACVLT